MGQEDLKNIQIQIETATEEHIPTIIKIEEQSWVSTYPNQEAGITKEDVRARFSSDFKAKRAAEIKAEMGSGHRYRVLIKDRNVIGYSHLLQEEDYNDFVEAYLLDEYHGHGYGGALLRDGLSWFGNNKPTRLEVATHNAHAKAIYGHFGFQENPMLRQAPGEDWNVLPSGRRIPVIFMERPQGTVI